MDSARNCIRSLHVAVALAIASGSLASCGFAPMYATSESATAAPTTESMSAIQIRPIAENDGVKLRQVLREGLQPRGPAARYLYDLDVQMRSVTQDLGVRKDATSSRTNLIYSARFALLQNGKRVLGDQVQTIISYNIADDPYATVVSANDASERAIKQIGEQIKMRIGLYFQSLESKVSANP